MESFFNELQMALISEENLHEPKLNSSSDCHVFGIADLQMKRLFSLSITLLGKVDELGIRLQKQDSDKAKEKVQAAISEVQTRIQIIYLALHIEVGKKYPEIWRMKVRGELIGFTLAQGWKIIGVTPDSPEAALLMLDQVLNG